METQNGVFRGQLWKSILRRVEGLNSERMMCMGEAGFYPSTFVYSRFFPKIEFFYCLHENAYPTHFLALKNTLSIADKHPWIMVW